jgi:hypothetical protein
MVHNLEFMLDATKLRPDSTELSHIVSRKTHLLKTSNRRCTLFDTSKLANLNEKDSSRDLRT